MNIPIRYLPNRLSRKDKQAQAKMLQRSRRNYKNHKYYTRKAVPSFKSKTSNHILDARRIYGINKIKPSRDLSRVTGCSPAALRKIVNKGEGAYFSSGSRPNQTAQSWGFARLASSVTGGKSAAVDYDILKHGCDPKKRAMTFARRARKKYGFGHSSTRKVFLQL